MSESLGLSVLLSQKTTRQKIPDEILQRLAQYWSRAALMHDLLHALIDEYGGIQEVIDIRT
jgi:hypothetical protein